MLAMVVGENPALASTRGHGLRGLGMRAELTTSAGTLNRSTRLRGPSAADARQKSKVMTIAAWSEPGLPWRALGSSSIEGMPGAAVTVVMSVMPVPVPR